MNDASLQFLFFSLILLLVCSAYFSASETAMMTLNRYRLRHLAKQQHKGALRAQRLLENPDRLIGVILIGNNFVNILASSITTVIAIRLWGDAGILIGTAILTILILVFSEVSPKTLAVLYPERIAFPSSLFLHWLLKLLHPLVSLVSGASNSLLRLCGIRTQAGQDIHLSTEELRTVVDESAPRLPRQRQDMLLNVLDLEKVTVNDIMVTRSDVVGIDIEDDIDDILEALANSAHTRLPVYRNDLNNIVGFLHIRNAARVMVMEEPNKAQLLQLTREPYFVPESTPLTTQLVNFQKEKRRIALVVDEYGDVKGIVTLEDILEEIVGNFTSNMAEATTDIHPQPDGSYLIDGSASIREINRSLGWNLPTDGPKTLNGLLTELLESIPDHHIGLRLPEHCVEILQVKDNIIKSVRMWKQTGNSDDTRDRSEIDANQYD